MKTRNFLIFMLGFLGVGAFGGGGVFILSPSGDMMGGMSISAIENSPFTSFLIPGIILFTVLGVMPLVLVYALLKKPNWRLPEYFNFFNDMHWSWTFSIYVGFALIIWIQTEMIAMKMVHWSHSLYMGIALVILFVTMLPQVRMQYKK
ncbi:MAG: hypothetical protein PHT07_00400 [Paludibacter sp.]|nr:hypothetical protein [Paludibacter sp.]